MPLDNPGGPGVPTGVIAMWHGLLVNIPLGWKLCDGTLGTPNLLAKFVQGIASDVTNPGDIGGAVNKNTAGHVHTIATTGYSPAANGFNISTATETGNNDDSIADIRPPFYDVAYIMKD